MIPRSKCTNAYCAGRLQRLIPAVALLIAGVVPAGAEPLLGLRLLDPAVRVERPGPDVARLLTTVWSRENARLAGVVHPAAPLGPLKHYTVLATPSRGVCIVEGFSEAFPADGAGAPLKPALIALANRLEERFGPYLNYVDDAERSTRRLRLHDWDMLTSRIEREGLRTLRLAQWPDTTEGENLSKTVSRIILSIMVDPDRQLRVSLHVHGNYQPPC